MLETILRNYFSGMKYFSKIKQAFIIEVEGTRIKKLMNYYQQFI